MAVGVLVGVGVGVASFASANERLVTESATTVTVAGFAGPTSVISDGMVIST